MGQKFSHHLIIIIFPKMDNNVETETEIMENFVLLLRVAQKLFQMFLHRPSSTIQ